MATFAQFIQIGPYHVAGVLQTNIKVYHYSAGTLTLKDVWTDRAKSTAAAQPVASDGNGIVSFYADGLYKFIIKYGVAETTLYTYDDVQCVDNTTFAGEGTPIASANPLVLGSDGNFFHVTGTTGIASISASTLPNIILTFDGACALTHGSSFLLQNAEDYTTVAGDTFLFVNDGSGVWREVSRKNTARTSRNYSRSLNVLENLTVKAVVSSNTLTVSLVTKSGGTPSSTDIGYVSFRNSTIATEGYDNIAVTAATSVTLTNGSTIGTPATSFARIYVVAINNSGSVELGLYNPLIYTAQTVMNLRQLNQNALYSSTAEGGGGGADSGQVLYSTTARTSKAITIIGYIDIQTGAAGAWPNAPLAVVTLRDGTPMTGQVAQVRTVASGAVATGTTAIPHDDTIPQNTEGDEYYTVTVTPVYATSVYRVKAHLQIAHSADQIITAAIFLDSGADALSVNHSQGAGNGLMGEIDLSYWHYPGSNADLAWKVRAGSATGATTTINGEAGSRLFGGKLYSYLEVQEINV